MRHVFAACAWIAATASASAAEDIQLHVTLRDTGYMLGDLLDERVEARLPGTLQIDAAALPLPGRVTPWMEVRRSRLEPRRADGTQALVVTYQIFAEVEQATRVPLPAFKLRVRDGADVRALDVPEQSFLLSPGLPSTLADEDRELRPSPAPAELPTTKAIAGMLASLAFALACAAFLLWRYDLLPFLPRAPGPLARTWRRWRRKHRRGLSDEEHAALLRDMHAALNRSAGETLYPSTLQRLFERAPFLTPLRAQIEGLFGDSWSRFYGGPDSAPSTASVLSMLRNAADRERGVPC
jgi:mxaA protein